MVSEEGPTLSRRTVSVLERSFGVTAGLVGSVVIAAATLLDRAHSAPALYASPSDLLLHFAAESTAGAALWLVLRGGLWLLLSLGQAFPGEDEDRRRRQRYVTFVAGVAVGIVLYLFVVRPSSRSLMLPPAGWGIVLLVIGCAISFGSYTLLRLKLPKRTSSYGALLLLGGIALHVGALHRYLRHYGNLHSVILIVATTLVALGVGFLLSEIRPRAGRLLRAGVIAVLGVSLVVLALGTPSYSARRAVLVWGGVAKRVLLAVAWPLLDRDGDGAPKVLWGVDPDDRDPAVNALVSRKTTLPVDVPLAIAKGNSRRNLLWVVIDTLRVDSFERFTNERGGRSFSDFAYFSEYRSCSSRTGQVISQLIGSDRCDRRRVAGIHGRSLLDNLRAEGYRDQLIGYFPLQVRFGSAEHVRDDRAVIERAAHALLEAERTPRAIFVHLKGGHGPYEAEGRTPRERYENAVRTSLELVETLVAKVPRDWAVVVMGDHGEEFGEHGSHAHATTLYQEVLRTPLLMRAPGVAAGRHSGPIGCTAVPWKTLAAVGVLTETPPPRDFQYSALDVARGEFGYLRDAQLRALEIEGKKVIWSPDLGVWELYDLKADPREQHSIAEEQPRLLAEMQRDLQELAFECGHLLQSGHD